MEVRDSDDVVVYRSRGVEDALAWWITHGADDDVLVLNSDESVRLQDLAIERGWV